MKKYLLLRHFFCGAILIRFAVSKLFSWPISVAAFVEMAQPLGVDPTLFRYFTGLNISVAVLAYFLSCYLIGTEKYTKSNRALLGVRLSNLLGIGIMSGALLAEFFLRTTPKYPLVGIALTILWFSMLNLYRLRDLHPTEPRAHSLV